MEQVDFEKPFGAAGGKYPAKLVKKDGNYLISWRVYLNGDENYAIVDKNGMLLCTLHAGIVHPKGGYSDTPFVVNTPPKNYIGLIIYADGSISVEHDTDGTPVYMNEDDAKEWASQIQVNVVRRISKIV